MNKLTTGKTFRFAVAGILVVLAVRGYNASGQTETNLYSFGGSPGDGTVPQAGLVQGTDGNFYGTTSGGGTHNSGTVFRIGPSGSYTNLYCFGGSPGDGIVPQAGLVQGTDGNLYGTTSGGGTYNSGTVFRIGPDGSYTNLYCFGGSPGDGAVPQAGLVQGTDGNLYGTTSGGGTHNSGTVFRIGPTGSYTNLYSFGGSPSDGIFPGAGLLQGGDGNFYGTTFYGGTSRTCFGGCGTVFRISPTGGYTNLYSFDGHPNDGSQPAGLIQGTDGKFYGTTQYGGTNDDGTVFRISSTGSCTNLHSFVGYPNDGSFPQAGLVQGSDGNFYGTTSGGGTNDDGTVFRISPGVNCSNLYSFAGHPGDGSVPQAGLVQGSDGNFYGTTSEGGSHDEGAVFKLIIPLNPSANQISEIQLSSADIIFNIPSVAYETYQLQFSSSLSPTNWVNVPGVSVTNSIGALLTLTNFGGALQPQGAYRFDITP